MDMVRMKINTATRKVMEWVNQIKEMRKRKETGKDGRAETIGSYEYKRNRNPRPMPEKVEFCK